MKPMSIVFVLFLSCFGTLVTAQDYAVDTRAVLVSGTGSFCSQGGDLYEADGDRLHTVSVTSSINYFLAPHIFAGGTLGFTHMSLGEDDYHTINLGPTLGYALGDAQSSMFPFFAAGVNYTSMGDEDTISGTDIRLGGGLILAPKTHLGVIIEIGYHILTLTHDDWDESRSGNTIMVGVGLAGLLY